MYAILRTKRLKSISAACAHNLRTKFAKNVDPKKTKDNQVVLDRLGLSDRANLGADDGTYNQRLADYYSEKGAKQRTNSCQALEFVLTASPKFFKKCTPEQFEKWKAEQIKFLQKEFGDNLQFIVLHMDEKSPHFHAFISVEETKVQKYKNRYGEGTREKTTLNADRFNPIYLQKLQDRYAAQNKKFGLKRGLRNSQAVHQTLKDFAKQVEEFSKKADYTSAINVIIEGIPSVMGLCKKADIQKYLTPVLNSIMKQAKASKIANKIIPEKIEIINKLLEENEELNEELKDRKSIYAEAINSKAEDQKYILELEKRVEYLEQFEPAPAVKLAEKSAMELTHGKPYVKRI